MSTHHGSWSALTIILMLLIGQFMVFNEEHNRSLVAEMIWWDSYLPGWSLGWEAAKQTRSKLATFLDYDPVWSRWCTQSSFNTRTYLHACLWDEVIVTVGLVRSVDVLVEKLGGEKKKEQKKKRWRWKIQRSVERQGGVKGTQKGKGKREGKGSER